MSLQACPAELVKQIGDNLCYMDLKAFRQTEKKMLVIFSPLRRPDRLAYTIEAAKLANLSLGPLIPLSILYNAFIDLVTSIKYGVDTAFRYNYQDLLVPYPVATTLIDPSTIPIQAHHLSLLTEPCRDTKEHEHVRLYQYYIWEMSWYVRARWSRVRPWHRDYRQWLSLWTLVGELQLWDLEFAEEWRINIAFMQKIKREREREQERVRLVESRGQGRAGVPVMR